MKKDSVKDFLKTHQQKIDDGGFNAKIAERLKYCPVPQKATKKSLYIALIPPAFFLLAVLAIVLLGGWDVFIKHMTYNRLTGLNMIWPALTSLIMLFLSWLIILTLNWKKAY